MLPGLLPGQRRVPVRRHLQSECRDPGPDTAPDAAPHEISHPVPHRETHPASHEEGEVLHVSQS